MKKHIKMFKRLIADFEDGYIANHSATADRKRLVYERALVDLLKDLEASDGNEP